MLTNFLQFLGCFRQVFGSFRLFSLVFGIYHRQCTVS